MERWREEGGGERDQTGERVREREEREHWKEVEKDKWTGPHPKRFKIYRCEDMASMRVSKVCGNADGFAESVQLSTGWLHVA